MKRLTLAFLVGSVFTVGCGQRLVDLPPVDDDNDNPPVPAISSLAPQRGATAGGTSVVITGTDLNGATSVTFGSATASFTVNSSTQITALSPAGTGSVNVSVTTPGGTSNALPYAYGDAPLITGITPSSGLVAGGTTVVITGSAFANASSVTFGGTAATSFTVNSASQISAVTPAHAAGTVPVVVTTPLGASNVLTFTYGEVPQLVSIAPNLGPTAGGTVVTLTGDHLTGATTVTFDTTAVTTLTVVNDESVTVAAPAHAAGVVAVTITTAFGTSASVDFTYGVAPTLTSATPPSSPTAGGINVVLAGTNLTGATAVSFGSTPATSFTVDNDAQITAVAPAGTSSVNITVTTPFGTSAGLPFGYGDAPIQNTLNPTRGLVAGGLSVTITGDNFTGATSVTFGGTAAASFTVDSDTQITAVTPAHAAGAVDVVTTTPDGSSNALAFTYGVTPALTTAVPNFGPTGGGTSVVLTGTDLLGATAVTFGTVDAPGFVVDSATQITVDSPAASAAGDVQITVTTPFGTSSGVTFTYGNVPAITLLAPAVGPLGGGTSVVITGTDLTDATAVSFGGVAATSFVVDNDTQVTAVSPAGTGAVNVTVTTRYGTSNTLPFAYGDAPTVGSLTPALGLTAGGNNVTITGTNFTPTATVLFGTTSIPNASLTVVSPTQIDVTAPADTAGGKSVTVTTEFGTSNAATYTYGIAPNLTGISPLNGPAAGGTTVTLTGTNLNNALALTFGGTPVPFTPVDASTVTFVTPTASAGPITVQLTTSYGSSSISFTAVDAPTISSLDITVGPTTGGTTVTISGTNLATTTGVTFGGVAATGLLIGGETSITVTTPANAAGSVDVVVTTAGGSVTQTGGFVYADSPNVTLVNPNVGVEAGGETVTLTGSGFLGVTSVTFDAIQATNINIIDDTQLTLTTPAHIAGTVDVVVTNPAGSTTVSGGFTYEPPTPGVTTGFTNVGPFVLTGTNLDWLGTTAAAYSVFFCLGGGCVLDTTSVPPSGPITATTFEVLGGTVSDSTWAICPASAATYDPVVCTNEQVVP